MRAIAKLLLSLWFGRGRRIQVAALPWRRGADGRLRILLVTSRGTGRWILPKGWPMAGKRLHQAAAQEAWEEAGVRGEIEPAPAGSFLHLKSAGARTRPFQVQVFPLLVAEELSDWPEKAERKRRWVEPEEAAALVREEDLALLIRSLSRP